MHVDCGGQLSLKALQSRVQPQCKQGNIDLKLGLKNAVKSDELNTLLF